MKILSGQLKGRNFYMPAGIRPTQSVTRKAVFDIIGHDLTGVTFLDLFSGSGAVGLEALSLGASQVVMVERNPKCADTIRENIQVLGYDRNADTSDSYELIPGEVFTVVKAMARTGKAFDVLFADPPYHLGLGKKLLKTLGAYDILHPNCLILIEYSKRDNLPEEEGRFHLIKQKKYGKSFLAVYQGS